MNEEDEEIQDRDEEEYVNDSEELTAGEYFQDRFDAWYNEY